MAALAPSPTASSPTSSSLTASSATSASIQQPSAGDDAALEDSFAAAVEAAMAAVMRGATVGEVEPSHLPTTATAAAPTA